MAKDDAFVIVGASLAGANAAQTLRDEGFDGSIVLIGDERELPYERPPLSKDYLMGKSGKEKLYALPADWYAENNVELRLGESVIGVDRGAKQVTLASGQTVGYTKLLLTTGSSPRRLSIPGADADGVHYLRTVDDADALNSALVEGSSLAVVGGGWIGLEVAAGARDRGVNVTVVEMAELPLMAALGREVGEVFATLHREHGVDLRLGSTVQEITTDGGKATGLKLGDGSTVDADAVLVAVGAAANTALAEHAGLALGDGGVLVDSALRTSDADIFAVGDIAAAEHPLFGTRIRTEHWANALKQPAVAVAGMLGRHAEYDELPYFFTDQYDLGMEYVGHAPDYQKVVFRGDVAKREFTAFWLGGGDRVLAGMNVNIWEGLDDIKALIRSRAPLGAA
jgi:3-phenylpropionate/trans-cinnamate dioxygenase ferredoxin reductase subunit